MHHTTQHLKDMGKQVCLGLLINSDLDSLQCEEPQPLPDGERNQIVNISRKSILEELRGNQKLLEDNEDDTSSGSDSDPSEDNLDPEEITNIYPSTLTPKPKLDEKKTSNSPKKRAESNRSLTSQKERNKIVIKCKLCGEQELSGHVCSKPKPKLRPIMKTQTPYTHPSQPYYNAAGKKVRDQATQTIQITQPIVKTAEEQKTMTIDTRATFNNSPVKVPSRASHRTNSSDETSGIGKFWKNEKAFPNVGKNSRQSPSWKHGDTLKK